MRFKQSINPRHVGHYDQRPSTLKGTLRFKPYFHKTKKVCLIEDDENFTDIAKFLVPGISPMV